jgi:hypothetical protein
MVKHLQFLTKPENYNVTQLQDYEKFNGFNLALTHRNWSGDLYATKEDGEAFLEELRMYNEAIFDQVGELEEKIKLDFMIDVSVFVQKKAENIHLADFLEELDDFYSVDESNKKQAVKYSKKLRYHAGKLENFSYLYRWYFNNQSHPFAKELVEIMDSTLMQHGNKAEKAVSQHRESVMKVLIFEMIKDKIENHLSKLSGSGTISTDYQSALAALPENYKAILSEEIYAKSTTYTNDLLLKLFKYSLDEPSLFSYSVYALSKYFEAHSALLKSRLFILFQALNNRVEVTLNYSTPTISEKYVNGEYLLQEIREMGILYSVYRNFTDIGIITSGLEVDKLNVLEAIAQWASERIDFNKLDRKIFESSWYHMLPEQFGRMLGMKAISFKSYETIGGLNGEEILIKAIVYDVLGNAYYYPLFDSSSWKDLNSFQCAIIAYSICLLHDLCIEGKSTFSPVPKRTEEGLDKKHNGDWKLKGDYKFTSLKTIKNMTPEKIYWFDNYRKPSEEREDVFHLHLHTVFEHELIVDINLNEQINQATISSSGNHINDSSNNSENREEHWVSFHFRRLPARQNASEIAKGKAAQYGIKRIPEGFTFVDSFIKGAKVEDISKLRISALDVLNKSVSRLISYEKV